MMQRRYSKFSHNKMDLYRFLEAFETGCGKMKYDDSQKMSSMLFYLEKEEEGAYLTILTHQCPADWEEFKQMFIDYYHKTVYERTFNYLTVTFKEGSLHSFVKKKVEVLRNYLKTLTDCDLIQIIGWSLPENVQRFIMPKLCYKVNTFLEAIQEYENLIESEANDQEEEEHIEEEIEETIVATEGERNN